MKRLLVFIGLLFLLNASVNAATITYTLAFDRPGKHVASVEIRVPVLNADTLTFAMPAWAPGRYVIYNFAKNVFDVQAYGDGKLLARPILVDKQTWKVPVKGYREIVLRYRVFANTLDGTFSRINSDGATINGACIFMYVKGRKSWPVRLKLEYPAEWQAVTPMERESNYWLADNYDRLIDSPMEFGRLFVYRIQVLGKPHDLVFHQAVKDSMLSVFKNDLRKVIRYQASVFDSVLPYRRYVFFFYLSPDLEHPDGMEHLNSCRVMLRMDVNKIRCNANTDPDYDNLIWLSAHEFFHTWNVKRLRPLGLGPFDYSKEVYTSSLWIVEGWTSYYAYLALLRTGIYTEDKFLFELSGRITRYEHNPGKKYRTLAETSILTWLFKGHVPRFAATNIDTTTYSYYYKGLIAGFLLDILLRSEAQPSSSLDELVQALWRRFYQSTQTNYYLPGHGYTEKEVEQMILERLGKIGRQFLQTTVHSTEPMPYNIVGKMGLKLVKEEGKFKLVKAARPTQRAAELWRAFKTEKIIKN